MTAHRTEQALSSWRTPLRRYGAAPLLALYCGMLCVAALPRALAVGPLGWPRQASRALLWSTLRAKAGEEVFAGRALDDKQRFLCVTVFGWSERRPLQPTIGFQSFPRCEPPTVRLHDSPFSLALSGSVWLLLTPTGDMDQLLASGPKDERLQAISRYFCSSPRSAVRGSDEVVVVVEYHKQHYYTGEITRYLDVVHDYACDAERSIARPSSRFIARKHPASGVMLRSAHP